MASPRERPRVWTDAIGDAPLSKNSLLQLVTPQQLEFDFNGPPTTAQNRERSVEPLLTIGEACAAFNLKPHVLRRAIKAKSIPSYRIGNGRIRLRASDITRAIDDSRAGGAK